MQLKSYLEATDWLFQQFPSYQLIGSSAYKPDLGNVRAICNLVNNPQDSLKLIHVAGTNGKGSTSSLLASILSESGEKVGLFTSPHIIDFRERIRVNGIQIPESDVIAFCNTIKNSNLEIEPSFFEITFAMALVHFKKEKCTISIIETGLGGRLDATNIITPILSIITNISIEHTQFLGNTYESIAFEKAGIIKPTVPVVIGETNELTKLIFQTQALKNNAPIVWCEEIEVELPKHFPLLGSYQKNNFRTVHCAIQLLNKIGFVISTDKIDEGVKNLFKNTGFRGRMQVIESAPLTILDVSHNLDGVEKTLESIKELNKGTLHLIYGSSSDKNYEEIVGLFPKTAQVDYCVFTNSRSVTKEEWVAFASRSYPNANTFNSVQEAIKSVQATANKEDTILVFGSFFLISDFF